MAPVGRVIRRGHGAPSSRVAGPCGVAVRGPSPRELLIRGNRASEGGENDLGIDHAPTRARVLTCLYNGASTTTTGEDGSGKGGHGGLASSQADGSEPPRARVPHPSPRAGAPDEAPSGAREHPPPRRARRGKGFPSAPDDKGGPAGPASDRQEDHGDGRPGTVQSWFRQLDTLGLSALLRDAGRELFNRDIYRWREVADVANELLDQETLAARRRLVEQMTSGSGVREGTERNADGALH